MASLTGTKIKDTYDGLLKTTDNGGLGASAKQITDGLGTGSPLYIDTTNIGIGAAPLSAIGNKRLTIYETTSTSLVLQNSTNFVNIFNGATVGDPTSIFSNVGFKFAIATDASATGFNEAMRIDSSGNVKLTSEGYQLAIQDQSSGNISEVLSSNNAMGFFADRANAIADSYMLFSVDGSERMRITSGGYLKASNNGSYFGASSAFHEFVQTQTDANTAFFVNKHATNPYGIFIFHQNASPNNSNFPFIEANDSTTTRFRVWSNGNVVNFNNSYGAISDAKLKENITDASPKLADLMQVKIRNYNVIGSTEKQLGVVAQELEEVFPAMISESPDTEEREVEKKDENGNIVYETEQVLVSEAIAEELDEEGNVIVEAQEAVYETVTTDRPVMTTERVDLGTTTKSVKYSVFVPILVKAMQEQQEIINKLEARIAALEAK